MSAQTGHPTVPPLPPSSRRIERARTELRRWWNDPNPVWMRENRQFARRVRTPVILAVLTGIMTLLMASIGGILSVHYEPAKVGVALYQVFFSLAFFGVTWAAPAVAASGVAGERSGRTWEPLLLTGLGPTTIARGLLGASLTSVMLYLVMLAPVAALPFLFGGVTASEVLLAFVWLVLFGGLSAAFGLSVSSKFSSPAGAIVVTLFVSSVASLLVYLLVGVALSFGAHALWPDVSGGPPVWLPTAYVRAEFGAAYWLLLVVAPLGAILLPGWFFYEVTVANLSGLSDDRSSGLRRWLLVTLPVVTLGTASLPLVLRRSAWQAACSGLGVLFAVLVFAVFVIAGEPLGPSRRVRVHWEREGASRWRRYLGPGILKAATLLGGLGLGSLWLVTGVGAAVASRSAGSPSSVDALRVVSAGGYLGAFFLFILGFTAWVRTRASSAALPRLLLAGALLLSGIGPWVVMAIAGVVGSSGSTLVLAAPSPAYVLVMLEWADRSSAAREPILLGGVTCALSWALLGAGLLNAAYLRTRRVTAAHARALHEMEAMLDAEDEALHGSEAPQS
jgi:hypothetical protein